MSYADTSALGKDPDFNNRVSACLDTEAIGKTDDVSDQILKNNPAKYMVGVFMPFVASAPGLSDAYAAGGQEAISDGDILSAVQGAWARVGELT